MSKYLIHAELAVVFVAVCLGLYFLGAKYEQHQAANQGILKKIENALTKPL